MTLPFQTEDIIKLLVAMALGGMIGMEREIRDKSAGFRTLMFISAGSALFTIISIRMASITGLPSPGDATRIAAQIVTGIGFLGAGVILREQGKVRGLTTAATIWLAAALGMGAGAGMFIFSFLATVLILLALLFFPSLEGMAGRIEHTMGYLIVGSPGQEQFTDLVDTIHSHNLRIISSRRSRKDDLITYQFDLVGRPERHAAFVQVMITDAGISEFHEGNPPNA